MAKQIIKETIVSDDINPEVAEGVETIAFSFAGVDYEVDLGGANREQFEEALAIYIEAGRRVAKSNRSRSANTSGRVRNSDAAKTREWCRANFEGVGERGRIPAAAVEAYRAAHAA